MCEEKSQMIKNMGLLQQPKNEELFRSGLQSAPVLRDKERALKDDGGWISDEALRLVQQVFLLQSHEPARLVVFAGIDHGNGCSRICASVARTLAKHAQRPVCLVEANFRSPTIPELFGEGNHHGFTEALLQRGTISDFVKPSASDNLWLLTSGTLAVDSANLLTSERLQDRLKELREEFEFVVIDAPPLTLYSDAIAVGQLADGLVLVLEADSTRRKAAQAAVDTLRSSKIDILAAVLNKRTFPIPNSLYKRL
jgi:capsular exopolysaccharide synthesis family protein